MFIKKIVKTYKNTGRSYTEYRFVRGYRTSVGPRHQTLLTVREIPIPEPQWKRLADTMDAILNFEQVIFVDNSICSLAEYYCTLIRARHPEFNSKGNVLARHDDSDDLVYKSSIRVFDDRSFGPEYVAHWMYERLKLDDLFKRLGYSPRQRMLISLSIIGRLVNPGSENSMRRWAKDLSAIDGLIGCDLSNLGHNSLYRISDTIYQHKNDIEVHLCECEREVFNLQESLCIYDLTNTFFEGTAASISKARFGRSKEKRSDCRLISLGMVVDEQGFCKKSNILEGAVSEPHTLKEMIDSLSSTMGSDYIPTVVMDAGIATKDNLQYLVDRGCSYLCVSKNRPISVDQIDLGEMIEVHKDRRNLVTAKIFRSEEEIHLFCHSQKMECKERAIQERFNKLFEDDLENIISCLTKRYSNKSYGKIMERIGRLRERYSSVSRFYQIDVVETNGMVNHIEFNKIKIQEEEDRFSGSYWLRTNLMDWNEQKIWDTYTMLNKIESAFRSLKHELAFRPIFHRTGIRAEAHIFIAILAYHLLNAICYELQFSGISYSWDTVRSILSTHRRVSVSGLTTRQTMATRRMTTSAEPSHIKVYKALNLNPDPRLKEIRKGKM
ncbi:MAG: IS1634 family transposase [Chloroflexi bacterium]|nr:IS1634 family transposase [Chloroflexota bacterium]